MIKAVSLASAFAAAVGLTIVVSSHPGRAADAAYYTSAQAAAGAKAYAQSCSQCHGAHLEGVSGPALKGAAMHGSQAVADIYGFMAQQMPAGAPGSLKTDTYVAIAAYLLAQNGHPAGKKPLTAASVKKITAKI